MSEKLPNYRRPPVDEIVAAVQFRPLPRFRLPEIVKLSSALDDWELVDSVEALPPIVERPPGEPGLPHIAFAFGAPSVRAVFQREDQRWRLQVQQDRIAVHEVRTSERPRAKLVLPELGRLIERVGAALSTAPLKSELVELIYVNRLDKQRGFAGFDRLGDLFVGLDNAAGTDEFASPETTQLAWTFVLAELPDEPFVGRLRVELTPTGPAEVQLQFNSRRYVGSDGPTIELEKCRADIVKGFTSMTTEQAHEMWERYR